MADFETTKNRLSCPHTDSCRMRDENWTITASTRENTLSVDVECFSCPGQDHQVFSVESFDRSTQTKFEVGETFTLETDITQPRKITAGSRGKITAIADNPLYADEKCIVGVIFELDQNPPYPGRVYDLKTFQDKYNTEFTPD